jgi:hypothetical protein
MKLNLRKASVVQNSIRAAISERQSLLTGTHEMCLWAVNDEALAEARGIQNRALDELERLESILVGIRDQVGTANAKNGVNRLLAEQTAVAAGIARYSRLAKSTPLPSSTQLSERAKQITASNEKNSFRVTESFSVGVFSTVDIQRFSNQLTTLRRRQTAISEELITINIGTEISVRDQDWSWLESLGIV